MLGKPDFSSISDNDNSGIDGDPQRGVLLERDLPLAGAGHLVYEQQGRMPNRNVNPHPERRSGDDFAADRTPNL
jgi:hypothetical protein